MKKKSLDKSIEDFLNGIEKTFTSLFILGIVFSPLILVMLALVKYVFGWSL